MTDTLLNASGPTAQVAVDSLGTSTAYAAFPYPGDLLESAPGLAAGLLSLGAGGLPPIAIPSLPSYPLYVSSNAQGTPSSSTGAGPYSLSAKSEPSDGSAAAMGGLETPAGNIALLRSTAALTSTSDAVVSTATSVLTGLTIGPLTIGEVKSTATETLGSDGSITPTSELSIAAAKVGTLAVALGPDGLDVAGQNVSVGLNKELQQLLAKSGLTVSIEPQEQKEGTVISPALVITAPVNTKIGTGPGTLTLTIGSATATMLSTTTTSLDSFASATDSSSGASQISSPGSGFSLPSSTMSIGPTSSAGASPSTPLAGARPAGAHEVLVGVFDLRALYLLLVLVAAFVIAAAPLQRLLAMRKG